MGLDLVVDDDITVFSTLLRSYSSNGILQLQFQIYASYYQDCGQIMCLEGSYIIESQNIPRLLERETGAPSFVNTWLLSSAITERPLTYITQMCAPLW
jgi:hypothetical protein